MESARTDQDQGGRVTSLPAGFILGRFAPGIACPGKADELERLKSLVSTWQDFRIQVPRQAVVIKGFARVDHHVGNREIHHYTIRKDRERLARLKIVAVTTDNGVPYAWGAVEQDWDQGFRSHLVYRLSSLNLRIGG